MNDYLAPQKVTFKIRDGWLKLVLNGDMAILKNGPQFKKYCLNFSKLYRSLLHQYVLDPVDKEVNYPSKNNHGRSKTFSCGPPMFKH